MKEIRTGFATSDEAHAEAHRLGLNGYIVNGPKADGTFSIKIMTMPPTQEGLT